MIRVSSVPSQQTLKDWEDSEGLARLLLGVVDETEYLAPASQSSETSSIIEGGLSSDEEMRVPAAKKLRKIDNDEDEKRCLVRRTLEKWGMIRSSKARAAATGKDWRLLALMLARSAFSDHECHIIIEHSYGKVKDQVKETPKGKAALNRLVAMDSFRHSVCGSGEEALDEQLALQRWDECRSELKRAGDYRGGMRKTAFLRDHEATKLDQWMLISVWEQLYGDGNVSASTNSINGSTSSASWASTKGSSEGRIPNRNTSLTFRKATATKETRSVIKEAKEDELLEPMTRKRILSLPASISIAGLFEGYRVAAQRAITDAVKVEGKEIQPHMATKVKVKAGTAEGLKISKRVRRLPVVMESDPEWRKAEKMKD